MTLPVESFCLQKQSENQKASEIGPNYYVVKRHRVGSALLGLVRRALEEGKNGKLSPK